MDGERKRGSKKGGRWKDNGGEEGKSEKSEGRTRRVKGREEGEGIGEDDGGVVSKIRFSIKLHEYSAY